MKAKLAFPTGPLHNKCLNQRHGYHDAHKFSPPSSSGLVQRPLSNQSPWQSRHIEPRHDPCDLAFMLQYVRFWLVTGDCQAQRSFCVIRLVLPKHCLDAKATDEATFLQTNGNSETAQHGGRTRIQLHSCGQSKRKSKSLEKECLVESWSCQSMVHLGRWFRLL